MKARLLTKLLNDTGYTVNNNRDYIAVGSPLCHDLIKVMRGTFKLSYALDFQKEGRKALEGKDNAELLFIWDKLQELIDNGEIKDIIEGQDELENPLPVFTVEQGRVIATFTDEYGYPNATINGDLMYDNTYFKTRREAIEYGMRENHADLLWQVEKGEEIQKKLADNTLRIKQLEDRTNYFLDELSKIED